MGALCCKPSNPPTTVFDNPLYSKEDDEWESHPVTPTDPFKFSEYDSVVVYEDPTW